jgi:hypothetical protein
MRRWLRFRWQLSASLRATRAASLPLPRLRGRVREGANSTAPARRIGPLPGPPPQAGEGKEKGAVNYSRLLSRVCSATVSATLVAPACALAASPLAVTVENASTPTLCAETDNIYLKLTSAAVRQFTIEATHPAYAGTIVADRTAPDFRNCDMSSDPVHRAEPRRVTIYETGDLQLIGHTFASFWRPAAVPVRVGARVETGLHLLQLFTKFKERTEEVLVLYPADGYWRARPLPPEHLSYSAYGSSFLIGPIEAEGRPFVDIRDITFDPATMSFRLAFARGGEATLRLDAVDREHVALDVKFDRVIAARPFAALRSMFVTETNADVARAAWRTAGGKAYETAPIMSFGHAEAQELWAGRRLPSRHNTSAPDMIFRSFTGGD